MSEPVSALGGAQYAGMVELAEAGPRGMITVRGDLALPALASAVKKITGAAMPARRQASTGAKGAVAWMSPDELLLFVDYAAAAPSVAALEAALAGEFVTIADVSDARAVLTLKGSQACDVLAKICPVDFADLPVGGIRRSRAAQIAAAIWREEQDEYTVICFRSHARYMWDMLSQLARPGGEVGLYR
ncbi:MAG: sarcosine oxidase subunit gamma [Pararhodobacter sp.]|nr:sarcosine oxidase subunit gamma [Pararhodobacter sp.]